MTEPTRKRYPAKPMLQLLVITLCMWVGSGSEPTQALVKSGSKEVREEDGEHSLRLTQEEVERLKALLLKKGIRANSGEGTDSRIELVASLSPLKPTARIGSGGKCSVQYRGIVISSAVDLASYVETNAVDFEIGAGDLAASLGLEMGMDWVGQRRFFLEIWLAGGSGPLEVTDKGELLAEGGMEEAGSLLTDPFVVNGTPDADGSTYRIEIRAGPGAASGTLGEIRLYRLK